MGRLLFLCVLLAAAAGGLKSQPAVSPPSDESAVVAVVQRTFDAMAAHDGGTLYQLMLPEASILAIFPDGSKRSLSADDFIKRTASSKEALLERMWEPMVSVNGGAATLVTSYDFHRDGKLSHCGVNAVTLLKSEGLWRISHISFTVVQQGCPASPLGKPKR